MKICKICANNDILCNVCNEKLAKGEITQLDVDISRAIEKLKNEFKIKNIDFDFCLEGERTVYIFTKKSGGLIGPGGRNVKKLTEYLGKPVKIIEKTNNVKGLIEKLIGTSPLIGINILYKNGCEIFKVRLKKDFKKKLNIKELREIAKQATGKDIEVVFE